MGPFAYNDPKVAEVLQQWFATSDEIVAEYYLPHSGGGGDFYVLASFEDYQDLIAKAPRKSVVFLLRDRQFPIRGMIDDELIARCLNELEDGKDYLILNPLRYPERIDYLGDGGNSHCELKQDLENLRGTFVWVGYDFAMPNSYWTPNTEDNVLIVIGLTPLKWFNDKC